MLGSLGRLAGLTAGFAVRAARTVSLAVHAGHTAGRVRHVSLERTLALDAGDADLIAAKQ